MTWLLKEMDPCIIFLLNPLPISFENKEEAISKMLSPDILIKARADLNGGVAKAMIGSTYILYLYIYI